LFSHLSVDDRRLTAVRKDLPTARREEAEAVYERLCVRWGDDLPQWRRAILAGRAKDLVLRPRNGAWARQLRRGNKPCADASGPKSVTTSHAQPTAATTDVRTVKSYQAHYGAGGRSAFDELPTFSTHASVLRLDVHGVTNSGNDGAETAQRILRAVSQAFDSSPHFSVAVPEKDLPKQWAWRLQVVAVP
jgi:hypothetical protein